MDDNKKEKKDQNEIKDRSEKSEKSGLAVWFEGIMGEFKRITWPSRPELVKMTVTVIVTSAIFGGVIVGYDFVLAAGYNALVSLFN